MFYDKFTVEEVNLIAIYLGDYRAETIENINYALPHMDAEMRTIAESAVEKLCELNEQQYGDRGFIPADETDGE
ncbi:MAG: transposon-transfer assisting family protein [Oscillospiraceae bacterium]|jgi:hypothetical protein|nr:transposon-transfer assisting family protein [Oscillospiraceae bacterium]